MSPRGLEAIRNADLVFCEDTRITRKLLSAFGIARRLFSLNEQNEEQRIPGVLAALGKGKSVAVLSDAGTPLVSDPGFRLVRRATAAGFSVSAVPGANAALVALTLSGLPPYPFLYLGFIPARAGARRASFEHVRQLERAGLHASLVWHEAPHRLAAALADLARCFGPREAAVTRELTKRFEEVRRAPLDKLARHYENAEVRGEITLVVGPAPAERAAASEQRDELRELLASGMSVKDAVTRVAGASGAPRKEVYREALALRRAADATLALPPPLSSSPLPSSSGGDE